MAGTRQTGRRRRTILRNVNEVINLLDGELSAVKGVSIELNLNHQYQSARIKLKNQDQTSRCDGVGELRRELRQCSHWERLGAAIGHNTTVRKLELRRNFNSLAGLMDRTNDVNAEVHQCIELLLRGIQSNASINDLVIDMDLFPCDGSLPALNLQDAQFKEELKSLRLEGHQTINDNQSVMIESFLESTSLKELFIENLALKNSSVTAFRRIIMACSKVEELHLCCSSISQCAAVANLMEDSRSVLSNLTIHGSMDRESLSAIAAGLANNTALKYLYIEYSGETSPVAKVLCDTSSIERVIASNHTLESIILFCNVNPIIQKYLSLNKNTNKELVIRTKIARYYFRGEFDVSTFASMDAKCLPRVLAMIGGGESYQTNQNAVGFQAEDAIYQQSAIFRLLKRIPDICNVSSRCVGKDVGLEVSDVSDSSKRQKVSK
eukprot:scaffold64495_cov38-Cyclotella_meneghiniana.AAC.2